MSEAGLPSSPRPCLACYTNFKDRGLMPHNPEIEHQQGIRFDPNVHWRHTDDNPSMNRERPGSDFKASSDPFDAGWGAIQKGWSSEDQQEAVDLERLQRERQGMGGGDDVVLLPPAETDIESDVDMGNDPCCEEAKNYIQRFIAQGMMKVKGMPSPYQQDRFASFEEALEWAAQKTAGMDCEEFRQWAERDAAKGNQQGKIVLANWDKCSAERLGAGAGDFTASVDPVEAGWDAVLKHIGPDNFQYQRYAIPHQTYSGLLDRRMGVGAGLEVAGSLPINEAIQHIESSPTLEDYARKEPHYYETAEDLGINRDDYDSDDEYYESLAEMGVGDENPRDYLEYRGDVNVRHIDSLNDRIRQKAGRPFSAEETRMNMEGLGEDWREQYAALSRDPMLEFLDELRDSGKKRLNVAGGSIGATGMGPMIDVNPLYQGQGLGQSVLAALLENTGRFAESRSSPGGFKTMQALSRQMKEQDIPHELRIDDIVHRPVQNTDWRSSDARYPHQGYQEMSIPEGTTLLPKQPTTTLPITQTLSGQREGDSPLTMSRMRELVSRAQRELRLLQNAPPSLRQAQPHEIPAWLNEIDWGDN
tara:strand:- start:722 stop:2485 length:1764 start_codon:yes stop_codon:yes gene_type:complete